MSVAVEVKEVKEVKFSNPTITKNVTLKTSNAQKTFERTFFRASLSLFTIEVVLNVISKQNKDINIEEIFSLTDSYIKNTDEELDEAINQINALLKTNQNDLSNIINTLEYSKEKTYKVKISSPKQISYLNLIKKFDNFLQLIDIAWMGTVLDASQRTESTFQWRRKVQRISSQIITLERKVKTKVRRKDDNLSDTADNEPNEKQEQSNIVVEDNS